MVDLEKIVSILRDGGIVIYPTDTAFGIGCRIDDEKAVQKLFTLRKRPINKVPPVLFSSIEMVKNYVTKIPEDVEPLLKKHWPGALTVILPAKQGVSSPLVIGQSGIGCRIPNHPIPLRVIQALGVPLIGASANFPGNPTPYAFTDLDPDLIKLVDFVIPGETIVHKESTVIDCVQRPWKVLRNGAVELN